MNKQYSIWAGGLALASSFLHAGCVAEETAFVAEDDETWEVEAAPQALAEQSTIQILTPDGQGRVSLDCSCTNVPILGCVRGHRVDKDVVFVLPQGYRRHRFSSEKQPGGVNAGGSVDWLTSDPLDARIRLHCWADAFSNATITVFGVTATRE